MRIALYQPDIPQNTGTILRLCACLGLSCDIIEPCGFLFDDRRMRRAGMDYLAQVKMVRHASWRRFLDSRPTHSGGGGRLVLLTTRAAVSYTDFAFRSDDTLLLGRESAGVPDEVHDIADAPCDGAHDAGRTITERCHIRRHGCRRSPAANGRLSRVGGVKAPLRESPSAPAPRAARPS